jgi:hypothetical protein
MSVIPLWAAWFGLSAVAGLAINAALLRGPYVFGVPGAVLFSGSAYLWFIVGAMTGGPAFVTLVLGAAGGCLMWMSGMIARL